MSLHERWAYTESDPAMMLFTAALQAWQMPILPGQSVLELGCNESPFLTRLHEADRSLQLTGVDARPTDKDASGWTFAQGSAWDQALFQSESFDWVVLLGALEHFGLGYYGDPVDAWGDDKTITAVRKWLKPGGSVYFDVPCNPEYAVTAHFRTYPSAEPFSRFSVWGHGLTEVARGYSLPEPHAGTWIPQPMIHRHPYHFVCCWARKG